MNCPEKALKWESCTRPRGTVRIKSAQTMVLGTVRQQAAPRERWPKTLKTKLTQGGPSDSRDHQTRVHSDQKVLMMAVQEAGLCIWWPHSRGELENNSRKLWDLTKNRHSDSLKKGQLTLFQGNMQKGDDDDKCVTRPSDSNTMY